MNVLIWIPPWPSQGDFFFHQNSILKHLFPQAETLLDAGFEVDIVLPVNYKSIRSKAPFAAKFIEIGLREVSKVFPSVEKLDEHLYASLDITIHRELCGVLSAKLRKNYDIILLWETPVPFLAQLFPEALIVHQMPGVFARPPYPHLVTFDATGLFRDSVLYRDAKSVMSARMPAENIALAEEFSYSMRRAFWEVQPFRIETLNPSNTFKKLALLPLQVSNHYSFRRDSGFDSQVGLLSAVMGMVPETTGVIITQYNSKLVSDTVLDENRAVALREQWPNIVFRGSFDATPCCSQYLLPFVDEVYSCSSSLAIQAQIWNRPVKILGETHYTPFDYENIAAAGIRMKDAYLNTLSVVLSKHQPLADAVISDRKFLSSILEEMVARKRSGRRGLEIQPDFSSIDPNYKTRLLTGSRIGAARKSLPTNELNENVERQVGKFARIARNDEIKAISFDVFDTLITRPTETPADVFMLLERTALDLTNGVTENFARVRLNAEVTTRETSKVGEITLAQIYSYIQAFYRLSDEMTLALIQCEIDLEMSLVEAREIGSEVWKHAQSLGKPLYVISDMYLPEEVIRSMLEKCGISNFVKLFVSSSHGTRKKDGQLFDIFLANIGIDGKHVLHIGDNKEADETQAKLRGMATFRIARAIDHMRSNPLFKEIYPPNSGGREIARSVVAGLTARHLFDLPKPKDVAVSHSFGRPFNLGFAGLGPLLLGYILWLERVARRDGISRLYFLSREGRIFKDVYDILFPDTENRIPSTYLYASRRTTRVASLQSRNDVLALAAEPYRAGVTVGRLLSDRFNLRYETISEYERASDNVRNPEYVLTADHSEKVAFIELCADLSDHILKRAETERESYLEYLNSVDLASETRPAVVDIGWRANMQSALGRLLGRNLHGYYLATLQGADFSFRKGHQISAYIGDFVSQTHPSVCIQNRHVLEFLICHRDPSLLYFMRGRNGVEPIFQTEDNHGFRSSFIDELHSGVRQFAKDFQKSFGFAKNEVWIDPSIAERALSSFIIKPAKADAELLRGFQFEDSVGGVAGQYIVAPSAKGTKNVSVWKAGASVLYSPKTPVKCEQGTQKEALIKNGQATEPNQSNVLRRVEGLAIHTFVKGKKLAKYERNRKSFFEDSNNPLLKLWARVAR